MGSASRGNAFPAPKPTNWWEDEEQRAREDWDTAGDWTERDRQTGSDRRDTAASGASTALGDYGRQPASPAVSAWSPDATKGYSASQLAQWMASATGGGSASAGFRPVGGGAGAQRGGAPGGASAFESENLKAFDPSAVTNFDPTAAGETFAKGAYGSFKLNLDDVLRDYEDESVGAGRLRTGEYDVGRGKVVTRLGEDFNNQIAQMAPTFSGQRLSALQSGTGMNLDRATSMDANARAIAELNANLGFQRERGASEDSLAYNDSLLRAYGAETDRSGLLMQGARSMDELGFEQATNLDKMGFDRATYLDTAAEGRARTGLDASLGRERTYLDDYQRTADRSADYAGASRDWAARDREIEDLRKELERLRNPTGAPATAGQGRTKNPAEGVNEKVAASFGVPYVGY